MFVLSNLFQALAEIVRIVLDVYSWMIIIRALLSWVSPDPYNPIVQFLHRATDPVLEPIRRRLPPMGIDISPIIVILAIAFLRIFLVKTLYDISFALR